MKVKCLTRTGVIIWNAQRIQTPKNLSGAKITSNMYFLASELFDLHTLIRKLISRYFDLIICQTLQKQGGSFGQIKLRTCDVGMLGSKAH